MLYLPKISSSEPEGVDRLLCLSAGEQRQKVLHTGKKREMPPAISTIFYGIKMKMLCRRSVTFNASLEAVNCTVCYPEDQ